MTRGKILLKILLPVVTTLILLSLIEATLQLVNYPKPLISGWKTLGGPRSELNQLGFRGQQIQYTDDDYVILLVGDSQVEARASAYEWMPERRLENYLNAAGKRVRVFSLGGPATGTDQQLLSVREYYQHYRADLVILWFNDANDVWNNIFPSNLPNDRTPKPTFWLENGELRGPTELTGQPARETPRLKLVALWRKVFPWPREKEWAGFLPAPYAPLTQYDGPTADDWQKAWDLSPVYLRYENFDTDKNDRLLSLTPRSQRTEYGIRLTRKLLQQTDATVAEYGGRLTILSVNLASNEDDSRETVHALNGKYYKTSATQLKNNADEIRQGLNRVVVPVTVTPWQVGPEDAHLNEHANDQVMKDLAMQIQKDIPTRQ